MNANSEILDAIEILADKKIGENITKILTGICKSVNTNNNTCVMDSNGVISTVQFYGSPPEANELYRIFVPSNNMSRSFIVVPPKFTVNPNLLDNWYFANPVNQRGLTEYSTNWNQYTIDRWSTEGMAGEIKVVVSTGCVDVTNMLSQSTDHAIQFKQVLPTEICLPGKTYTLSILTKNVVGGVSCYLAQAGAPYQSSFEFLITSGLSTYTGVMIDEQQRVGFVLAPGASMSLIAIKLELGSTQTLAHLENGNWVLNEIPDYGEQLKKCQRYFLKIGDVSHYCSFGNGVARDGQFVSITIPTPVTMRGTPGLVAIPVGFVMRHSDTIVSGGANFSVDAFSQNSIMLKVQSQVALTPGDMWEAFLQPNGSLAFSADL
jgi:hypothetical protein